MIVFLYIVLLLIFLVVSGVIVRHTVKYGSLAPTFKFVVGAFLAISLILMGMSIYFLFQVDDPNPTISVPNTSPTPAPSSDFNF